MKKKPKKRTDEQAPEKGEDPPREKVEAARRERSGKKFQRQGTELHK